MIILNGHLHNSRIVKRTTDILEERALEDSADYLSKNAKDAVICYIDERDKIYNICLNEIEGDGLHCEFGVHKGDSINWFSSEKPQTTWHGFDSFIGLRENWKGGEFAKGHFNLNGIMPKVNRNVKLYKGWFDETLPDFLKEHKEDFSFINIDCDTYEATKEVLNSIDKKRMKKGCVILFDEYFGYVGWRHNEFKAWQEYVKKNKINYKYIALGHLKAVVKII
jgi:hypothetical protein